MDFAITIAIAFAPQKNWIQLTTLMKLVCIYPGRIGSIGFPVSPGNGDDAGADWEVATWRLASLEKKRIQKDDSEVAITMQGREF